MRSGSATGRSCTGGVAAFRGDRLRDFGGTLEGADGGGGEGSEGRLDAFRCRKKEDPEGGGEPVLVEVDSEDAAIAEVPFVSNETGYGKREGIIRYIAIRRASPDALGVYDDESPHRPDKPAHAIRVLITNNPALGEGRADGLGPEPMAAQPVLKLLNGRCGDAEQAHDALKNGLAGGTMPSGRFGANAAWWMCAVPAFNLHALTAWWTLGEDLARGRLQADPAASGPGGLSLPHN